MSKSHDYSKKSKSDIFWKKFFFVSAGDYILKKTLSLASEANSLQFLYFVALIFGFYSPHYIVIIRHKFSSWVGIFTRYNFIENLLILFSGSRPQDGVPDMTVISNIDEHGINKNLQVRYDRDSIYVSHSLTLRLRIVLSAIKIGMQAISKQGVKWRVIVVMKPH